MPFPLAALAPLIGGVITSGLGYLQDRKNRKEQEKRNDADEAWQLRMLEEQNRMNQENWARQNEYNHPLQQMKRFEQAGLNKALVYGNGATTTAQSIPSATSSSSSKPAPKHDYSYLQGGLNTGLQLALGYANIKQSKATTDNLEEQRRLTQQETIYKAALTAKTLTEGARGKFDLDLVRDLRDTTVRQAQENLRSTELANSMVPDQIDNLHAVTKNLGLTAKNIEAATKKLEAETKSVLQTTKLDKQRFEQDRNRYLWDVAMRDVRSKQEMVELEITMEKWDQESLNTIQLEIEQEMQRMGISPSDPYYYRLYYQLWRKMLGIPTH